jgi:hypothetical protein
MSRGLGRVEQRVLAELMAADAPVPAHRIIDRTVPPMPTRSDKVCVRRALASLKRKGFVERETRGWICAPLCRQAAAEAVRMSSAALEADYQHRRAERTAEACALAARTLERYAAEVARLAPTPERDAVAERFAALAKSLGRMA